MVYRPVHYIHYLFSQKFSKRKKIYLYNIHYINIFAAMTAEEVKLAIKAEQAIFDLLDAYNRASLSLGNFSVKSEVDKETEPGQTIFTLRVSVFMPDNKTVLFDEGLLYKYNTGFYSSAYEPLNFDQYASDITKLMDNLAKRL